MNANYSDFLDSLMNFIRKCADSDVKDYTKYIDNIKYINENISNNTCLEQQNIRFLYSNRIKDTSKIPKNLFRAYGLDIEESEFCDWIKEDTSFKNTKDGILIIYTNIDKNKNKPIFISDNTLPLHFMYEGTTFDARKF